MSRRSDMTPPARSARKLNPRHACKQLAAHSHASLRRVIQDALREALEQPNDDELRRRALGPHDDPGPA
jgi:hypothetical protein